MRIFKRSAACLLMAVMICNLFPTALAVDEESILTSIGHSDANTVSLSGTERNVTLTVPYQYPGTTLDLVNGLDIGYDESRYKSVVAVPDGTGMIAIDDAAYLAVTVSFQYITDADDAVKSQTVYYVRAVYAEMTPALFSGVVSRSLQVGDSLAVTALDLGANYVQNDGQELGGIIIRGSNLVIGSLTNSGSDPFDTEIYTDASGAFIGNLIFTANEIGAVSYTIEAYEKNTNDLIGTAVLTISVYDIPTASDITQTAYAGSTFSYSLLGFSSAYDLMGGTLELLEITPTDNDYGTWYLGAAALTAGNANSIPAASLSSLFFKGTAAGTASFTWRVKTEAGFSTPAAGSVAVSSPSLSLYSYSASSYVAKGDSLTLSSGQFSYTPSTATITYLKIVSIPATKDGYLCLTTALAKSTDYGYPAISANARLVAGAIIPADYIRYIKLVTLSTSTSTGVSFTWSATADPIASTATWASAASYSVTFMTGGTVYYSADMNIPLTLDGSDFSTAFANATGYSLSYITFTLPLKTTGTLYYNYDVSTAKGTSVSASTKYYIGANPNLSYLTFVPAKDYTGSVSIAYKGYRSDGTYTSGTLYITVSNSSGGTFSYVMDKNDSLQFDAADFAEAFLGATGQSLSYVKFTLPSTYCGRLYYDYTSSSSYDSTVSSSKEYYVYSSPYLSYVTFVPYTDYTGPVPITFKGYTESGSYYTGKLVISVVDSPAGIVSYSTKVNGMVRLEGDDFADEFISVTGSVLSYVQFTSPTTGGTLYYQYDTSTKTGTKISASTKYYNSSTPDISDLTFVPTENYTGQVEIKYTVYTASAVSYIGKLKIKVGDAASGNISYKTDYNTPLTLRSSDFISSFYSATGGATLSYVVFTLPSSSYGKLYYNYTSATTYDSAVSASKAYFVSALPYLANITFVPYTGYTGSFSISYAGYAEDGTGYTGRITITVGGETGAVYYETTAATAVKFVASDFNTALVNAAGKSLYYVRFTLPSSSVGVLYYGYSSSGSYSSVVFASSRYYMSASYPYLSTVSFVPASGYSGTCSISYTAYDTNGESYNGMVYVSVSDSSGGTVNCETNKNTPITLNSDDFNDVFLDLTGSALYRVKFTLSTATSGQLYYSYTSASSYTSKVSASTYYYRSYSPQISSITFVPYKDFLGTVSIAYTCYTSGGTAYSGELNITVTDPDADPFTDVAGTYSWAESAIVYLYRDEIVTGTGGGKFSPGAVISRGDFMLMIYNAFDLPDSSANNFTDVSSHTYYFDAIAAARALGIAQGGGDLFYPTSGLSRQDAMVLIVRTLSVIGKSLPAGSDSYLSGFSDAGSISDYARSAAATLVKAGIITGSGGALHPQSTISRAEMAVILYRVLTM